MITVLVLSAVLTSPVWLGPLVAALYRRLRITDSDLMAVATAAEVTPEQLAAYAAIDQATDPYAQQVRDALAECHRLDSAALWLELDSYAT